MASKSSPKPWEKWSRHENAYIGRVPGLHPCRRGDRHRRQDVGERNPPPQQHPRRLRSLSPLASIKEIALSFVKYFFSHLLFALIILAIGFYLGKTFPTTFGTAPILGSG